MAYCSTAELNDAYGEDRIQAWSRLDADVVTRAIADASAEIDGYLMSGGYPVPIDPLPPNMGRICVDLAASALLVGVGVLKDDAGGAAVLDRAKAARRYLERVAEGKLKLPRAAAAGEVAAPPAGNVLVSARERLNLDGY